MTVARQSASLITDTMLASLRDCMRRESDTEMLRLETYRERVERLIELSSLLGLKGVSMNHLPYLNHVTSAGVGAVRWKQDQRGELKFAIEPVGGISEEDCLTLLEEQAMRLYEVRWERRRIA